MTLTHDHPTFSRQEDRLERLGDIKRTCLVKLAALRTAAKGT